MMNSARSPFHVMIKPIGPICNLACHYCFYLEKRSLYAHTRQFRMSPGVLEALTRQYIEAQPPGTPEVNFAWQGGEPTLLGIDYFKRAIELQKKYARDGMKSTNSLQTNGSLLDDEWGEFLREHHFLVGISIDGPAEMHDAYRLDTTGRGSFARALRGLEVLKQHEVEFNTLTCVHAYNSRHPRVVYDYLKRIGSTYLQFIPVVQKAENGTIAQCSVESIQYGHFLNGVFDRWLELNDVGEIFVRDFDDVLGVVLGYPSSLCTRGRACGRAVALEHNGDLFSCDHFVSRENLIGNIMSASMGAMLDGPRQTTFGLEKRDALPRFCRGCEFLRLCNGGCPKDRFIDSPDGAGMVNYLCEGFKSFYAHSMPVFQKMAKCLREGRPASDYRIMDELTSIPRNDSAQRVVRGSIPIEGAQVGLK